MKDLTDGISSSGSKAVQVTEEEIEKIVAAITHTGPETDPVVSEGLELVRLGKMAAARTQIEERLKEERAKQHEQDAKLIAEIKATRYIVPGLSKGLRVKILICLAIVIGGAILEDTLGEGFIFSGSNAYRSAWPWLFLTLIPVLAAAWHFMNRKSPIFRSRYPTWWLRCLIMWPLIVAGSTALTVMSPLGWLALSGWMIGTPTDNLDIRVISVSKSARNSGNCSYKAKLEYNGSSADICLEDRLSGGDVRPGDRLKAIGRSSALGIYIEELQTEGKAEANRGRWIYGVGILIVAFAGLMVVLMLAINYLGKRKRTAVSKEDFYRRLDEAKAEDAREKAARAQGNIPFDPWYHLFDSLPPIVSMAVIFLFLGLLGYQIVKIYFGLN